MHTSDTRAYLLLGKHCAISIPEQGLAKPVYTGIASRLITCTYLQYFEIIHAISYNIVTNIAVT